MNIQLISHFLLFIASFGIIWFFSGILVDVVNKVAKHFQQNGFTVALFVLGFLTSISEFSVMINSSINNTPQVSAGNLIGASFVIFLFIIPFLATAGNGITLKNTLRRHQLFIALGIILLPVFFLFDGTVTKAEGVIAILSYIVLLYFIKRSPPTIETVAEELEEELIHKKKHIWFDFLKIIVGAGAVFLAGNILVKESVYIADMLSIPSSIIGLLVLSLGTNVPEVVIAIQSIKRGSNTIAFGNYVGSAITNTLVFGILAITQSPFFVDKTEFIITTILMNIGFVLFFIFAQSKRTISRIEGIILLLVYVLFIGLQLTTFFIN
jgi:cation:H+ antiporter